MLKDQIFLTLRFFDELSSALTLPELQRFLFADPQQLRQSWDRAYEIQTNISAEPVAVEDISQCLATELQGQVEESDGYFFLAGKKELAQLRQRNDQFRLQRERIIARFLPILRHVPFVRGAAVGGSHTLGPNKPDSDIDLLIILDPQFLWLGRILVTAYFQTTGSRRHGAKIANRFCLNHYLAGPIEVDVERDPYNAMEYLRLRPEVYGQKISAFVESNLNWIKNFFPNAQPPPVRPQAQTTLQKGLEWIITALGGRKLNRALGRWQRSRIDQGVAAVASERELSFHSKVRKYEFLARVFGPN